MNTSTLKRVVGGFLLCSSVLTGFALVANTVAEGGAPTAKAAVGSGTETDPYKLTEEGLTFTMDAFGYPYISYEATQDGLITIKGVPSMPYDLMSDGIEIPGTAIIEGDSYTMYALVKKGQTIVWDFMCNKAGEYTIPAPTYSSYPNDGSDCENPIEVTEFDQNMFFPTVQVGGRTGKLVDVYAKIVTEEEGEWRVKACTSNSVYGDMLAISSSACDESSYTNVTSVFVSRNNYETDLGTIEQGEPLYLRMRANSASFYKFILEPVKPGASCVDAWKVEGNSMEIPAEAGEYWYEYTVDNDKTGEVVVVTSDCSGTILTESTCDDWSPNNYNKISVREVLSGGETRYFCVTKKEASAEAQTLEFTVSDLENFDSQTTAPEIEEGNTTTIPYSGTYYYKFKSPADDASFVDVKTVTTDVTGVYYSFFPAATPTTLAAGGNNNARLEAAADTEYILSVKVPVNVYGVEFNLAFSEIAEGTSQQKPFKAVDGDNEVPAWNSVWYTFTATETSWLGVKSAVATSVAAFNDANAALTVQNIAAGEWKFAVTEGKTYTINLKGATEEGSMELSYLAYEPGETSSSPLVVEDGVYDVPNAPVVVWLKYVVKADGLLTIDNALPWNRYNSIWYYWGGINETPVNPDWQSIYGGYYYKPMTKEVTAGEEVYVYLKTTMAFGEDYKIKFTEETPAEGMTVGTAIEIKLPAVGESEKIEIIDGTSTNKPGYYWFEVTEPISLNVFSYGGNTIFEVRYEERIGNVSDINYIAQGKSQWPQEGDPYVDMNVFLPEAGKYYFVVKGTDGSDFQDATFTVSAPKQGLLSSNPIVIEPGDNVNVAENSFVYAMETGDAYEDGYKLWYSIDLVEGDFHMLADIDNMCSGTLYEANDLDVAVAECRYDRTNEIYALNTTITKAGTYLYCVNATPGGKTAEVTFSGSAIVIPKAFTEVNVEIADGMAYSYNVEQNTVSKLNIEVPENWTVKSVEINGEKADVAASYTVDTTLETVDYVFTLDYDGEIDFIDQTTGVTMLDTVIAIYIKDGELVIDNTEVGDKVMVYNMGGMVVANHTAQNTAVKMALPAGTYVVTVNGKAFKALIP